HHRFGIVAQESGYYIDVRAQMHAPTSVHGDNAASNAYFTAMTHLHSAMEHGVLEQMQVNSPAVSTVKLLEITNAAGGMVFLANSSNYAAIQPQLTGYSSTNLSGFQAVVNSGYTLILPANGQITLQSWSGDGYIQYLPGSSSSVGMIIGGAYHGGYGVIQAPVSVPEVNTQVSLTLNPQATQCTVPSCDPVDMATGFWMDNNTDLSLSGGSTGGVAMKRAYISGNNNIQDDLGYGWANNAHLYIETHSNVPFGLGQRLPAEAAALITASVATLDIMNGTPTLQDWMVSALIGKWGMDQLTNNAASVHLQTDVLTYIKLPDGSYALPPGVTSQLALNGGLFTVNERFGRTVNFGSDNQATQTTDADGNHVTFSYSGGKLQNIADAFGHNLTFSYSGSNVSSVSDSAGRNVSYVYNGNNNLTSYIDPDGKARSYGYAGQTVHYFDEQQREVALVNALGNQTTRAYDGQNHVISLTDPRNNTTTYQYDGNNNLTAVIDPYNNQTTNTYDSQFHLVDVRDPLNHTIDYAYDSHSHPIQTTVYPATGQSIYTRQSYYTDGLLNTSTDGKGVVTTFTYDGYGNPATRQTSTAPAISYVYDPVGRMTSLTNQDGATTSFAYDNRSLLTSMTDPFTKTASRTYYNDGRLSTVTDRNNNTVSYTNTPTGKVGTITYPSGPTVSFTYDTRDNPIQMQDSLGTTTYAYDADNRPLSKTDPNGFAVSNTYDPAGNIKTLTYPGNLTVTYTYDNLNRLKTV